MFLERVSNLTGKLRTMNLPITPEELIKWERGALAQEVWPHLSNSQRDFIVCGVTPDERKQKKP